MNFDDEDENGFRGLYENGVWKWDNNAETLVFISNIRHSIVDGLPIFAAEPTQDIEFREDVDLIEQMRYRRNYRRKLKPDEDDIITVQDVKDLVIYTAPINILTEKLINMLHTATGERFLRALILYCAYVFQIIDEMISRTNELKSKLRTPDSDKLEARYRDNLSDLRVLVTKEYCRILIGAGDMKPFHHMGHSKKHRSLGEKDARQFEIFIRICVQIVYIALGRKYFRQIELETNRLLKSEVFNVVEHKAKALREQSDLTKLPDNIHKLVTGSCSRHERMLNTHSPLMNEVFCPRKVDYRLKGLGITKYPSLTPRLWYFYFAIAAREDIMVQQGIIVGIIGQSRTLFDTMLRILPITETESRSKSRSIASVSYFRKSRPSVMSRSSAGRKSTIVTKIYPDLIIPPKRSVETSPPKGVIFESEEINPVSEVQKQLWLKRFNTMMGHLKR